MVYDFKYFFFFRVIKEMTTKPTPICGHDQSVRCSEDPVHENCKEDVNIGDTLCGHDITVKCNLRNGNTLTHSRIWK